MCFGAELTKNAEHLSFFDIAIQEKNAEVGYAIVRHERYERICFGSKQVTVFPNYTDESLRGRDRFATIFDVNGQTGLSPQ